MVTSESAEVGAKLVEQDLKGRLFYRPGVIATYCILSLPVGLFLYSLNVSRRGNRVMGYALTFLSVAVFLGMATAGALGARVAGIGFLGIFVGIGLLNIEGPSYRLAMTRGGLTAKWWPPLLWVLATLVTVVIAVSVFGPEEIVK